MTENIELALSVQELLHDVMERAVRVRIHEGAVIAIQRLFQSFSARLKTRAKIRARKLYLFNAAVKVQSIVRMFQQRKRFEQMRRKYRRLKQQMKSEGGQSGSTKSNRKRAYMTGRFYYEIKDEDISIFDNRTPEQRAHGQGLLEAFMPVGQPHFSSPKLAKAFLQQVFEFERREAHIRRAVEKAIEEHSRYLHVIHQHLVSLCEHQASDRKFIAGREARFRLVHGEEETLHRGVITQLWFSLLYGEQWTDMYKSMTEELAETEKTLRQKTLRDEIAQRVDLSSKEGHARLRVAVRKDQSHRMERPQTSYSQTSDHHKAHFLENTVSLRTRRELLRIQVDTEKAENAERVRRENEYLQHTLNTSHLETLSSNFARAVKQRDENKRRRKEFNLERRENLQKARHQAHLEQLASRRTVHESRVPSSKNVYARLLEPLQGHRSGPTGRSSEREKPFGSTRSPRVTELSPARGFMSRLHPEMTYSPPKREVFNPAAAYDLSASTTTTSQQQQQQRSSGVQTTGEGGRMGSAKKSTAPFHAERTREQLDRIVRETHSRQSQQQQESQPTRGQERQQQQRPVSQQSATTQRYGCGDGLDDITTSIKQKRSHVEPAGNSPPNPAEQQLLNLALQLSIFISAGTTKTRRIPIQFIEDNKQSLEDAEAPPRTLDALCQASALGKRVLNLVDEAQQALREGDRKRADQLLTAAQRDTNYAEKDLPGVAVESGSKHTHHSKKVRSNGSSRPATPPATASSGNQQQDPDVENTNTTSNGDGNDQQQQQPEQEQTTPATPQQHAKEDPTKTITREEHAKQTAIILKLRVVVLNNLAALARQDKRLRLAIQYLQQAMGNEETLQDLFESEECLWDFHIDSSSTGAVSNSGAASSSNGGGGGGGVSITSLLNVAAILTQMNEGITAIMYARRAVEKLADWCHESLTAIALADSTSTATTTSVVMLAHRNIFSLAVTALHNVAMAQGSCHAAAATATPKTTVATSLSLEAIERDSCRSTHQAALKLSRTAMGTDHPLTQTIENSSARIAELLVSS